MFLKNKGFFFFTSNHNVIITRKFSTLSNIQLIYKFPLLSHNLFIVYFFKLKFNQGPQTAIAIKSFWIFAFPPSSFFIVFSPNVLTKEAVFVSSIFHTLAFATGIPLESTSKFLRLPLESTSKFLRLLLYKLVARSWGLIRIMFHVWQDCLTGDDVCTLPPTTHSVLSVLAVKIDKGVSLVHPPKNSHQHQLSPVLTNFNNHSPNT